MGAVDHVVGRAVVGRLVDRFDRLGERLAGRQSAVSLEREGWHRPARSAARTMAIASLVLVFLRAVTISAPAAAKLSTCKT